MITNNRKHNNPGKHRSETIRQTDHDSVSIAIVIHGIVRRERY